MDFLKTELTVSDITVALHLLPGQGTPIHKNRPAHGLAFNVDTSAIYTFENGKSFACHAGEVIYLPKGASYTVKKEEPLRAACKGTYAINFQFFSNQNDIPPSVVKVKGVDAIISLFSKAAHAWSKKSVGYREECLSDLYRIIKQLKSEREAYAPTERSLDALAPALAYIRENYTKEAISVGHLAELCHVSEPYVRRLFGQAFSLSPALYIRNLRIHRAMELLRTGEYTVTEAASLSGFNDTAYFSREFKKATGASPKDYIG